MMGLATDGGPYRAAWAAVNAVQGIALPLAASVPLALSALVPGWRWRLIDLAHALLIAALVILWAWAG